MEKLLHERLFKISENGHSNYVDFSGKKVFLSSEECVAIADEIMHEYVKPPKAYDANGEELCFGDVVWFIPDKRLAAIERTSDGNRVSVCWCDDETYENDILANLFTHKDPDSIGMIYWEICKHITREIGEQEAEWLTSIADRLSAFVEK